jgi:uncharacterized RDD family membrane protein YckC
MTQGPGTPPMGGAPTGPTSGVPASTAGLGVRIGARILDALLVGIPASIVLAIIGLGTGGFGMDNWLSSAVISLLWFGYFVWFESNSGATLGKKLLNLRVVVADGSNPSLEEAAKRNVWMLFGLVPWVGGLISLVAVIVIIVTISSNTDSRGMHDTFAGTAVMR